MVVAVVMMMKKVMMMVMIMMLATWQSPLFVEMKLMKWREMVTRGEGRVERKEGEKCHLENMSHYGGLLLEANAGELRANAREIVRWKGREIVHW